MNPGFCGSVRRKKLPEFFSADGRTGRANSEEILILDTTDRKSALRREFTARRKAIPLEVRQRYDAEICAAVAALDAFKNAEMVAAFISFGAEPDLSSLFHCKKLLLPRFNSQTGVYELAAVDDIKRDLLPGKYGIPEPSPLLPVVSPDIVASRVLFLTPAVACDRMGNRLGRGGGFYDRLLAGVQIPPVAVIYSCQLCATALPGAHHDVKMGTVVTEREVIVV